MPDPTDVPTGRSARERRIEEPSARVVDVVAERNERFGPKRQILGVDVMPAGRSADERGIDIPPVS